MSDETELQTDAEPAHGLSSTEGAVHERVVMCEQDGEIAARNKKRFGDACPYLYRCFPGMTIAQFNEEKRPLMDAWFRGWKRWIDENGKLIGANT